MATRCHHLYWFQIWPLDDYLQIWPPDGTTCITNKFAHQTKSHALPDCLGLPYWHYQLVLTWYLHQPESHQLSLQQPLGLSEWQTTGPIDRTPGTPGSDKNYWWNQIPMVSCSGCNYDESYVEDNINADDDDDDHDDDRWQWMDTTKMDKSYNNQTDKLILMKVAKSYNQKLTKFVLIWSGLSLHSEAVHNLLSGLFASTFASKAVSSTDNKRQQYRR